MDGNFPKFPTNAHAANTRAVHGPTMGARKAALEARIVELQDQLRARDDFLAMAAHELRNPMTPISAQLELLLAKTPKSGGASPALLEGLQRLEQLVDGYLRRTTLLLEVSRIQSGSLRLQIADVDLSALVRKVTASMIPLADRAGCAVRLMLEDRVFARCDGVAMEQVLENLLSNAVRYGAGEPIEVTFSSERHMSRLSVQDHGVGIAEPDQPGIFERFHTVRWHANGGFGVGLWVARRLVTAMQGEITVSSTPGAGSIFTVKLPLSTG